MKPILEVKNISKQYHINETKEPYLNFRDVVTNALKKGLGVKKDNFLALDDISFDVYPGETVGIIGKNGAGKSTLLKILSRITPPSTGNIKVRGRIASLLEVGTGFHPELSGRENIFLNGSILGMRKTEILKNFDAIVDFSGIEKFIDTPIKHYSSGMQLRLAFAVAAFLENEILIIDEVLAVGDSEFQRKCMGKMEDVSKSGKTILFVSHQLSAIESLCKKGILLNKGKLLLEGEIKDVVSQYISLYTNQSGKTGSDIVTEVEVNSGSKQGKEILPFNDIVIKGKINIKESIQKPTLGIVIRNVFNVPVIGINNKTYGVDLGKLKNNNFEIKLHSPSLTPGYYTVDLYIGDGITDHHQLENLIQFEVQDENIFLNGKNPEPKINSFIIKSTNWEITPL
ncbi:MAG: ABC transporter ATP-binding protein [Bacteroidota bacterium]